MVWAAGTILSGDGESQLSEAHAIMPVVRDGAIWSAGSGGGKRTGDSSPMGAGPALQLQCPVRDRASHLRDNERNPGSHGLWISTCLVPSIPCGNTGHGHHHRPQFSRNTDPDTALCSSLGPEVTMAPVVTQAIQTSVALGHHHGLRSWSWSRPQTSEQPSVATGAAVGTVF